MKNYIFEIHKYSPEQNKLSYNGISLPFEPFFRDFKNTGSRRKDYQYNLRLYRSHHRPNKNRKGYIISVSYVNKLFISYDKKITGLGNIQMAAKIVKKFKNDSLPSEPLNVSIKSYFI